jgi:hypothetical protein
MQNQNEVWVFEGSSEQVVKALFVSMVLGHLVSWPIFQLWKWRQIVPPKCQLTFSGLHSVTSQKTELFITTAVRTWNSTITLFFIKHQHVWHHKVTCTRLHFKCPQFVGWTCHDGNEYEKHSIWRERELFWVIYVVNVIIYFEIWKFHFFSFQSPEMIKMKLKLLELEFEEEMKQKTERLKPRLLGCIWIDSKTSDYGMLFVILLTHFLFQCFNPEIGMQPISRFVCSCLKFWEKWHALFQGIWLYVCVLGILCICDREIVLHP